MALLAQGKHIVQLIKLLKYKMRTLKLGVQAGSNYLLTIKSKGEFILPHFIKTWLMKIL